MTPGAALQKLEQAEAILAEMKVHRDNLNTTLYRAHKAGIKCHVNAYYVRDAKIIKPENGVELMQVDVNDIGMMFPPIVGSSE